MKTLYQTWVHGHSALLEHGGTFAVDKATVNKAYGGHVGDLVGIGAMGGAACFRYGWGARFVVVDLGSGDAAKTGTFFVHYSIPTPTVRGGIRTQITGALLTYSSPHNIAQLAVGEMHVFDGRKRIFASAGLPRNGTSFDGSAPDRVLRVDLPAPQDVLFGVGVSLRIDATSAKSVFLEIHGVGIEFMVEDQT